MADYRGEDRESEKWKGGGIALYIRDTLQCSIDNKTVLGGGYYGINFIVRATECYKINQFRFMVGNKWRSPGMYGG